MTTRAIVLFAVVLTAGSVSAQVVPDYRGFTPLDSRHTPGMAARFMDLAGRAEPGWFQPIRIDVEDGADVSIYHARPVLSQTLASPAQLGVIAGHTYRLRLRNIPEMPGVELFPTIEVIDRLHPPAGREHEFPVPVNIDRKDIELALTGNLVTRVVYLEQPQLAAPFELDAATRTRDLEAAQNALQEADRFGRPVLILRMGGRLPSVHGEPLSFYGTGGPIARSVPSKAAKEPGDAQGAARFSRQPELSLANQPETVKYARQEAAQ
ncbi:MAG: hypothetical protein ACYTGL_09990 [Planctomycetota bacterium]|jgi:hypothetical protein